MNTRLFLGLFLLGSVLSAANYPKPVEGDWVIRDFRFHTGETLPELRLHYSTVGPKTGEQRCPCAGAQLFASQKPDVPGLA